MITGDSSNTVTGNEPQAAVGIPIVAGILASLVFNERIQAFFRS